MDHSAALHKLMEAAALVGMVEELANPGTFERLSPSSLSGLRITLRNIRESIVASHDALTEEGHTQIGLSPLGQEIRKERLDTAFKRRNDLRSVLGSVMDAPGSEDRASESE